MVISIEIFCETLSNKMAEKIYLYVDLIKYSIDSKIISLKDIHALSQLPNVRIILFLINSRGNTFILNQNGMVKIYKPTARVINFFCRHTIWNEKWDRNMRSLKQNSKRGRRAYHMINRVVDGLYNLLVPLRIFFFFVENMVDINRTIE